MFLYVSAYSMNNLYLQSESKANLLFTEKIKIGPIPLDKCDAHINYKDVFFVEAVAVFLLSESVVLKVRRKSFKDNC